MSKGVFDVELLGPFGLLLFQTWSSFKCQGFTLSENQIKKLLLQEVSEKSKEKLLPGGKVKRYLACPGVFRGLDDGIGLFTENP